MARKGPTLPFYRKYGVSLALVCLTTISLAAVFTGQAAYLDIMAVPIGIAALKIIERG